ncbi:TIGR04104 family putative zinc finger protein [Sporosarcina sp. JAI121]|uniref:TIGR04104 family putative zinc finger protein n=1 Tax=Sporosarcina sp. JAI121 TaxID=2723064 RepID=UPI0015C72616|nr:TIGR04104 family putative zinc finger protein [Sporosarcina sp. JAI121]NYF26336.1 CXXC-20-CXXC protein [Sporosarcina sp. JAI121]
MPNCESCGRKWNWKNTFIKFLRFGSGIECLYCGEKQFVAPESRKRVGLISISPSLTLIPAVLLKLNLPIIISILCVTAILAMVLALYMIELSNEDEPLW